MNPNESCLVVHGVGPNGQCVTAHVFVSNNCTDTLTFADGWTPNGGKLVFYPGESGYYDANANMKVDSKVDSSLWVTTAVLGQETITFTIRTYPR
jgi:hypothetical protein